MRPAGSVLLVLTATLATGCGSGLPPSAESEGARAFPTPSVTRSPAVTPTAPAPKVSDIPAHPGRLVYEPFTYTPPSAREYRGLLRSGPVVYAAEDHERPLVNVTVVVRGGTYLSPRGKEGLAELAGALLTSGGTRSRRAKELDEELAFLAAQLHSSFDFDRGTVSLGLLSKDLDRGLAILRDALTEPAFEEERLLLRKKQLLADMRTRNDDAAEIEERERAVLSLGAGYFLNRLPTKRSFDAISRADLVAFHRRAFDVRNLLVTASGDFDRAALLARLETFFSSWPIAGELSPPVPRPSHEIPAGLFLVDKDVNQGRVSIVLPGLQRSDPDWIPAQVMNEVLGGNDDTSRISNAVRSDEGLAYSARSVLTGGVWFPGTWRASFQSKSRSVTRAGEIVLSEMLKMREGGATDAELDLAKRSIVDTLPRRFASKAEIVSVLADEEYTGRFAADPEHYARFRERYLAVTKDDVLRVARRLLPDGRAAILVVGKKSDIASPLPAHPVPLRALTNGTLVQLPLVDPLTMEALGKPVPLTN
jgi:zinc protease